MAKKVFKVVMEYSQYSKKKGSIQKSITVAKNIATVEEAVAIILQKAPDAKETKPLTYTSSGFIYPNTYKIK